MRRGGKDSAPNLRGGMTPKGDFLALAESLPDSLVTGRNQEITPHVRNYNERWRHSGEDALTSSDSSASSKITNINDDSPINGNVEPEVVAKLLKQATVEVLSSNDVSRGSKKLLDSLVEVSLKELCALPMEKEVVTVLISEKAGVLVFCFAVWLITVTVILIFSRSWSSRGTSSFYLPPT